MIEAILAVLWFMILVSFLQVLHLHAELRITREAKHRYLIKAQQRKIEELERKDSADGGDPNER